MIQLFLTRGNGELRETISVKCDKLTNWIYVIMYVVLHEIQISSNK